MELKVNKVYEIHINQYTNYAMLALTASHIKLPNDRSIIKMSNMHAAIAYHLKITIFYASKVCAAEL